MASNGWFLVMGKKRYKRDFLECYFSVQSPFELINEEND